MSEVIKEETADTATKSMTGTNIIEESDLDAILDKAAKAGGGINSTPPPPKVDADGDEDEDEWEASDTATGIPTWGKVAIGVGVAGAIAGIGAIIGKAIKNRR